MAKPNEVEEVTERTVRNGGILTKLYFDMQSEKPDDLQPLMTDLISNNLLKSPGVVYCFGAIDEPIKLEKTYSTNAIVTLLTVDLGALMNIVFNFAPAGVEIIKPDREYLMKTSVLQSILLNLSQVSADYSEYILSKVLGKEELEKVMDDLKRREALGKRLMKKEDDADKPV